MRVDKFLKLRFLEVGLVQVHFLMTSRAIEYVLSDFYPQWIYTYVYVFFHLT